MIEPTIALGAVVSVTWDAIVVGAGPAGSLAARQLAMNGSRVLLVDRGAFPRRKVCGACLNGPALEVLRSAGLSGLSARQGAIGLDSIELSHSGRSVRLPLPEGQALSRDRLDAALVEEAIAAGVEFLPETRAAVGTVSDSVRFVELQRRDHPATTAEARVVLLATGLNASPVADESQVQTRTAAGSRVGAGCIVREFPDRYREATIFMAVGRGGYVGLVRIEEGSLNIAAAFARGFLKQCGGPGAAAASVLLSAGLPAVPALETADWQGTPALTRQTRPVGAERLFLLGDATGYIEPFTGEGMAWAMASALAVGPLALRGIERWDPSLPRSWAALHRRLVGRRQGVCYKLTRLLQHPWLAGMSFELMARIPGLAHLMIQHVNAPFVFP